jgi:hypothetical protein
MALPNLAPTIPRRMDPRDKLDIYAVLTQGEALRDILQPDEAVTGFSVGLTAEAAAAGLQLGTGDKAPRYADRVFYAQLSVAAGMQGAAIFSGAGLVVGVEITFTTNIDDREKQYTVGVKVVNK